MQRDSQVDLIGVDITECDTHHHYLRLPINAFSGNEPPYMTAAASWYMYSTMDQCCTNHFGWNYDVCVDLLPGICARALFYPGEFSHALLYHFIDCLLTPLLSFWNADWAGGNVGCIDDGTMQ